MNTTSLGKRAEEKVASDLKHYGYKILAKNWRTRWCEIDVVAQKDRRVYFVEVKYRLQSAQGDPEEFVTKAKLRQMEFAAEFWTNENNWNGDTQLVVAPVIGSDFRLDELIFLD